MAKIKEPEPLKFAALVAHNLAELRERRGLTATQAAELCRVSLRTYYYWEMPPDGSTGASVGGNLDNIAQAFNVPLLRLLQAPAVVRKPRSRETAGDAKRTRRFARSKV